MIEAKLYARLATVADNVYPLVAPKNYSTPCVVYQRLDTKPLRDLVNQPDCAFAWFQVKVYDPDYLASKTLATSIRTNLGQWTDATVQSIDWLDEHDMLDDTTETDLYCTVMRFAIFTDV